MVRMKGLEPSRRKAPDPKSGVYTNFTTSACANKFINGVSNRNRTGDPLNHNQML